MNEPAHSSIGYGPRPRLYFDGDESKYELFEVKLLSFLRLQGLLEEFEKNVPDTENFSSVPQDETQEKPANESEGGDAESTATPEKRYLSRQGKSEGGDAESTAIPEKRYPSRQRQTPVHLKDYQLDTEDSPIACLQ